MRSYFLSNERSWTRKLREAFMAISLELRYDKDDLMAAYVNEIYLGQDGARAVHGFGLASQFYFGKPLAELDLHELALLVAVVRGPTYYDPRRHADRALERRNLVLQEMADARLVSTEDAAAAKKQKLDLLASTRRSATQSAFLGLVRRQLAADYPRDDLERAGLVVLTTLDPAVQAAAERALTDGIAALGKRPVELDGAVIVTSPHTGEVNALVGGRRTDFEGFNRALDARRPIGSLIKPAVYLAALESGRYNLATIVEDSPIEVKLPNGDTWTPTTSKTRRTARCRWCARSRSRSTWRRCAWGSTSGSSRSAACSSSSVSSRSRRSTRRCCSARSRSPRSRSRRSTTRSPTAASACPCAPCAA